MVSLPSSVRIWLASQATDLRKSFDSLAELVRQQLQADPLSGQLFVFRNILAQGYRKGSSARTQGWPLRSTPARCDYILDPGASMEEPRPDPRTDLPKTRVELAEKSELESNLPDLCGA